MLDIERHRLILSEVSQRSVVTIKDMADLLSASESTVRRDITELDEKGLLRKIRGGAEALTAPAIGNLVGRPFNISQGINSGQKQAIARAAANLCHDGDSIIINGGTTTSLLAQYVSDFSLHVLTNSLPVFEYLLKFEKVNLTIAGGSIYREQNIVLSPFENDVVNHFFASKVFLGAQGISRVGVMESDPLVIQAESQLIKQAEKVVVLADSEKFQRKSSMVLCTLEKISTLVTDAGIDDHSASVLESHGVEIIIADENDVPPPSML
ncbi:DeoR family transcriptional regulator [Endozoicomonas sp. OPT23]|uniref:DeoR/GlpR family DNA-binding transcription regulator n=1 Tax=Endozoicomonas sp. OPT23 TaxID=2072845 RepID=UPI00129A49E9|nr:DeoR/GlpR family DNA-binding transcription regulator [Endozoicomonas sp. OPT23]MRI31505.1 DeoR family transcriptional regulator [Endozoicomonas sp. OPT23]